MGLNSQLYLQHLNGDESRKDNTRYLIIEDGTARYMKNMQERTIPVFSHGRLYAIAQGIISLPNPELSADIAVRTLWGFMNNLWKKKHRLCTLYLKVIKNLFKRERMYKDLQLVSPFHSFGFHRELKIRYFMETSVAHAFIEKIQMGMQPLTTLQTRTEFAKRQDLPSTGKWRSIGTRPVFGRVYPQRQANYTLLKVWIMVLSIYVSDTQYILSTSPETFPIKRYSTQRDAQYSEMDTMDIPEPIEEGFEDAPTGEGIRGGSLIVSS